MEFTPDDLETLLTLLLLGCTCGVVTSDDSRRWDRAQANAPSLAVRLARQLLAPTLVRPDDIALLREVAAETKDTLGPMGRNPRLLRLADKLESLVSQQQSSTENEP